MGGSEDLKGMVELNWNDHNERGFKERLKMIKVKEGLEAWSKTIFKMVDMEIAKLKEEEASKNLTKNLESYETREIASCNGQALCWEK